MPAQSKTVIKSYFETGDKPTQTQFVDLIDSYLDVSAATGGTVTSVGLNMSSIFTVSGSPITSSGVFRVSAANQNQGLVWAAPVSAAGAPTFRRLVNSDLPIAATVVAPVITGYLPSSQTFTSNVISSQTITSGIASDSTNTVLLAGGSFSWNITNGNAINGYQGGTTLPNSTTIHFYVIAKADLSAYACFASNSLTPTLPATYTFYRRIFSLPTNSSGVLPLTNGAIEGAGGSFVYYYNVAKLDISVTNLSTSLTLYPLTVPSGIVIKPFYKYNMPTTGRAISLVCPLQEGGAALPAFSDTGWTTAPGYDTAFDSGTTNYVMPKTDGSLLTDNSGSIYAISTGASTALYFVTRGFEDFRR